MPNKKTGRIIVTVLTDMASSLYEGVSMKDFCPIAHLPLGYGLSDCKDREIDFYESVTAFTKIAREEGSHVFILGFGPRMIPASWIKAAELIIQGSEVKVVLIPLCKMNDKEIVLMESNPAWRTTLR